MVGQALCAPRLLRRLYSLESEDTLASILPAVWPPQARGASPTFLERRVMPPRQAEQLCRTGASLQVTPKAATQHLARNASRPASS